MATIPITAARLAAGSCLLGYGIMELVLRRRGVPRSFAAGAQDRGSTKLILASFTVGVMALTLPPFGPRLRPWAAWTGIALSASGLVVRFAAMRTLGSYYTRTLLVVPGQHLVRRGVYRRVRHPGYLSTLLIWGGAAAASESLAAALTVWAMLAFTYVHRIRAEEQMLRSSLGQEYADYQASSWRLIPFIY
jgi:protein-S-isoprenylcysteine O-methyltransferase Ste14